MAEPSEMPVTTLGDMPFDLAQSFYSRTDKRGVIVAGNTVFQSVSGFEWGQILGAPHKIVRNHDTPRAAFRIMWAMLQSDQIAVAYVRNKTNDGRGYWVLALIVPTEDGYMSVRIKPTTPNFEKVAGIYRKISSFERGENGSVEESEARLLTELSALGFANYPAFQTSVLLTEFRARSLALSPKLKNYFADIDRINQGLGAIKTAQGELLTAVESLRDLPTNMRIVASRLEPSGGPLSAMSDIYNATSSVLFQEITDFALGQTSISKRMGEAFEKSCFFKSVCLLIEETMQATSQENLIEAGIDSKSECDYLASVLAQTIVTERETLQNAERLAQDLNRASYDLRRSMLGLDTIRVMGLVESGRLGAEGSRIGATMEQIGACHSSIIALLQGIKDNATIVNAAVSGLRMHFQKRGALAAS
jgi:aryl carrier-like protein